MKTDQRARTEIPLGGSPAHCGPNMYNRAAVTKAEMTNLSVQAASLCGWLHFITSLGGSNVLKLLKLESFLSGALYYMPREISKLSHMNPKTLITDTCRASGWKERAVMLMECPFIVLLENVV